MRGALALVALVAACGDDGTHIVFDGLKPPDAFDGPTFAKGADQIVVEDAGLQSVSGWATALSTTAGEFEVVADDDSLFAVPTTIDPAGTLAYIPADNANGSTMLTVRLHDGAKTSAPATFVIGISARNDPPRFTPGSDVTVDENSAPYDATWATNVSTGPNNEQQSAFWTTTVDMPALFSTQPAVDTTGGLSFTPAANQCGVATVTVTLSDGIDATTPLTFTIAINCP